MAMSYSYELQAKVFDRMTEMENALRPAAPLLQIPQTYAAALLEAGRLAQIADEQAAQLAIAAPKVEFVDKYTQAEGAKGFREVAKLLRANEAEFKAFLDREKIMYRLASRLTPYQNHIDAGRFVVLAGVSESGHAYNESKFTPKGVQWIAGEWGKWKISGSLAK